MACTIVEVILLQSEIVQESLELFQHQETEKYEEVDLNTKGKSAQMQFGKAPGLYQPWDQPAGKSTR
jgi:hypothetical protein